MNLHFYFPFDSPSLFLQLSCQGHEVQRDFSLSQLFVELLFDLPLILSIHYYNYLKVSRRVEQKNFP